MHRGVQIARADRIADFRHEGAALAAMCQQLAGLVQIAGCFELDDLDLDTGSGRGQAPGNLLGLGQRHGALAGADPYSNCHRLRSIRCRSGIAAGFRPQHRASRCRKANASPARLAYRASSRIMSEAFSAIMMVGALVLPDIRSGITEASTTRRPSMPRTRRRWSTTASGSLPMRQVEVG